jgi:hypothetical protein
LLGSGGLREGSSFWGTLFLQSIFSLVLDTLFGIIVALMEGSNEATGNLLPYLEEHKVAFRIFVYKYLEPANVRMQVDKRDVYKRYFRWLETHISSQKSRFLGVNVNGTINANAPHTSLIYQISSSEVDWNMK